MDNVFILKTLMTLYLLAGERGVTGDGCRTPPSSQGSFFAPLKFCSNNIQCDLKTTRIVLPFVLPIPLLVLPIPLLLLLSFSSLSSSGLSYCDFLSFSFSALSSITATMTYAIKTTFATTAAVAPARVLLPILGFSSHVSFREKKSGEGWDS